MEFLDEESRPRILFQSRPQPPSSQSQPQTLTLHKPTLFISLSLSSLLFALSLLYLQSDPLKSLVFWFALSLLLGPFAPSSVTAGDIRVGVGPPLQPPPPQNEVTDPIDSNKRTPNRRSKPRKPDELGFASTPVIVDEPVRLQTRGDSECERIVGEERDWSEGDLDLLKKQMVKHPVGKPGRWEAIAEAFRGRHGVESVIKKAKSMGERKVSDADSFTRFLKDRKPVDKRIEAEEEVVESGGGGLSWSAGEDIALLNALKAFPKDVPMRWEKIVAAVPGKSKSACMKRVAELKKDFRSSKSSAEA